MKFIIYSFLFSLLFLQCKKQQTKEVSEIKTIYPLRQATEIKNLKDYIEDIKIVNFEVTEKSLLSYTDKVLKTNDGGYIVKNIPSILKFDSNGKFLFEIGAMGRGPNEYINVREICISHDGKTLFVIDAKPSVIKFNVATGSYIETIQIDNENIKDFSLGFAVGIDNDFFIPQIKYNSGEKEYFSLSHFDHNGKLLEESIPVKGLGMSMPIRVISNNDKFYIFSPISLDNISYKIDNGKISPFLKIDFEKKSMPEEYYNRFNKNLDINEFLHSNYFKLPVCVHMSQNCIYFICATNNAKTYTNLYFLNSEKNIFWIHDEDDDFMNVIGVDDDYFYVWFEDYRDYADEQIKNMTDPLKKAILEMTGLTLKDENQNPVLIKIKMKQL